MPWSRDGRSILVRKMLTADGERSELWIVPVDGSAPKRLDFDANRITPYAQGRIRLHPDGHQITFVAGRSRDEVWLLENFLPAAPARASTTAK